MLDRKKNEKEKNSHYREKNHKVRRRTSHEVKKPSDKYLSTWGIHP